jgi:paraquat-inducible protein A
MASLIARSFGPLVADRPPAVNSTSTIAAGRGLATCGICGLLAQAQDHQGAAMACPRCGTRLHPRRAASIERSGALLLAAAICYVPANMLPVLLTTSTGMSEADTILGGVVSLYTSGSWFLALIVLVASLIIPAAKIGVLAYLLAVASRRRPATHPRDCTRLYRLLGLVGRWSMLDVFVAGFVIALLQWGPFLSERTGPGLPFFAATVVLTMLATMAFDPRLVWDAAAGRRDDVCQR